MNTRYHTRSGSAYLVSTNRAGQKFVTREKLGNHHKSEKRAHRLETDKIDGTVREILEVRSPWGDPCVGHPLLIIFDASGESDLYTSVVTSIEEVS